MEAETPAQKSETHCGGPAHVVPLGRRSVGESQNAGTTRLFSFAFGEGKKIRTNYVCVLEHTLSGKETRDNSYKPRTYAPLCTHTYTHTHRL